MSAYQILFERLELKYVVSEQTALAIRGAVLPYCEADDHNGAAGDGYFVRSLYLDSPTLACFRAKEASHHDRLKLRVRAYDEAGPVNLEVKRKRGDVVWKERAAVERHEWELAARGWLRRTGRDGAALERFARLVSELSAEPQVVIDYRREAFASRFDGYARVTFDRVVLAYPTAAWRLADLGQGQPVMVPGAHAALDRPVVLELKCERHMPGWMMDLIHDFELRRMGFSKYSGAMRALIDPTAAARSLLWELRHG